MKVSVYITNHNYGKYIKEAIESVLKQHFHDYEMIIIDDGSTDNSRQIIENYRNLPQVKIIYQKSVSIHKKKLNEVYDLIFGKIEPEVISKAMKLIILDKKKWLL